MDVTKSIVGYCVLGLLLVVVAGDFGEVGVQHDGSGQVQDFMDDEDFPSMKFGQVPRNGIEDDVIWMVESQESSSSPNFEKNHESHQFDKRFEDEDTINSRAKPAGASHDISQTDRIDNKAPVPSSTEDIPLIYRTNSPNKAATVVLKKEAKHLQKWKIQHGRKRVNSIYNESLQKKQKRKYKPPAEDQNSNGTTEVRESSGWISLKTYFAEKPQTVASSTVPPHSPATSGRDPYPDDSPISAGLNTVVETSYSGFDWEEIEPDCLRVCRRALAGVVLRVSPPRLLVRQNSDVSMSCHVTAEPGLTASVDWRFGAPRTGCGCSQTQKPKHECGRVQSSTELISANQTVYKSRLNLTSIRLEQSGHYTCVVTTDCCLATPHRRQLFDAITTYIHVYHRRESHHQVAVIAAVCTCVVVGLMAAVILLKMLLNRRKSSTVFAGLKYQPVQIHRQDALYVDDVTSNVPITAAENSRNNTENGRSNAESRVLPVLAEPRSFNNCPSNARNAAKVASVRLHPTIYPNPLSSPEFEIPLTPADPLY